MKESGKTGYFSGVCACVRVWSEILCEASGRVESWPERAGTVRLQAGPPFVIVGSSEMPPGSFADADAEEPSSGMCGLVVICIPLKYARRLQHNSQNQITPEIASLPVITMTFSDQGSFT